MKNIIGLLFIGLVVVSVGMPQSVQASSAASSDVHIETLQKLVAQLQAELAMRSQQTATKSKASLTYSRSDGAATGQSGAKHGVVFMYDNSATCVSMKPEYKVSFGDGKSAKADCKGVVSHIYKKSGVYTAKYIKKGKVLAKVRVVVDGSNTAPEIKKPAPLYDVPGITAAMNVASIGKRRIHVTGMIYPPSNCVGTEYMEVELLFGDQRMSTYSLSSCKPNVIDVEIAYGRESTMFIPELRIHWVDAATNVWNYKVLSRFKVDYNYSDTNPVITRIMNSAKG